MQLLCWVAYTLFVLNFLAKGESAIVRRQIRRIVKRLDRSANDLIDHVRDSLEEEDVKPRAERKPEGRRRGRSRSRSRESDGLTSLARPILRQVLRAKKGILGNMQRNVGVQANIDNGKWNLNLKIGGRQTHRHEGLGKGEKREEEHRFDDSDKLNTIDGEDLAFKNEIPPTKSRLNFEWPGVGGEGVHGHLTHTAGGSQVPLQNGKVSIGTGFQPNGWQPPQGYTTGQAANPEWFRRQSSERDDSGWSLESKEDEIFSPLGKVTTTKKPTGTKRPQGALKRSKLSSESGAVYEDASSSEEKSRVYNEQFDENNFSKLQSKVIATPVSTVPPPVWTPKPWNDASTMPPSPHQVPASNVNTAPTSNPLKWSHPNPMGAHDWLKPSPILSHQASDGWTPISKRTHALPSNENVTVESSAPAPPVEEQEKRKS